MGAWCAATMTVHPNSKSSTTDSFTASDKNSTKRSSESNWSYSTQAYETEIETISSVLTENTLSMISTPWSTESWNAGSLNDSNVDFDSSIFSWTYSDETLSSSTVQPRSSTSYAASTPTMHTSRTTVTIQNVNTSVSTSSPLRPLTQQNSQIPSETFSSWTVETFTSSGWVTDIDSRVIRAKYPWSPNSVLSGTDIYPSSLNSLSSRKGSRVTIATTGTFGSKKGEKGHMTPMTYMGLNSRPGENPVLKWALQVNHIPMGDAPNIIAAV